MLTTTKKRTKKQVTRNGKPTKKRSKNKDQTERSARVVRVMGNKKANLDSIARLISNDLMDLKLPSSHDMNVHERISVPLPEHPKGTLRKHWHRYCDAITTQHTDADIRKMFLRIEPSSLFLSCVMVGYPEKPLSVFDYTHVQELEIDSDLKRGLDPRLQISQRAARLVVSEERCYAAGIHPLSVIQNLREFFPPLFAMTGVYLSRSRVYILFIRMIQVLEQDPTISMIPFSGHSSESKSNEEKKKSSVDDSDLESGDDDDDELESEPDDDKEVDDSSCSDDEQDRESKENKERKEGEDKENKDERPERNKTGFIPILCPSCSHSQWKLTSYDVRQRSYCEGCHVKAFKKTARRIWKRFQTHVHKWEYQYDGMASDKARHCSECRITEFDPYRYFAFHNSDDDEQDPDVEDEEEEDEHEKDSDNESALEVTSDEDEDREEYKARRKKLGHLENENHDDDDDENRLEKKEFENDPEDDEQKQESDSDAEDGGGDFSEQDLTEDDEDDDDVDPDLDLGTKDAPSDKDADDDSDTERKVRKEGKKRSAKIDKKEQQQQQQQLQAATTTVVAVEGKEKKKKKKPKTHIWGQDQDGNTKANKLVYFNEDIFVMQYCEEAIKNCVPSTGITDIDITETPTGHKRLRMRISPESLTMTKLYLLFGGRRDFVRQTCYFKDPAFIYTMFGIHACRNALTQELQEVTNEVSRVDTRQLEMTAHWMCHTGTLFSMNKTGLSWMSSDPVNNASYEGAVEILRKSAEEGGKSDLKATTSRMSAGLEPEFGTNFQSVFHPSDAKHSQTFYFSSLLDEHKMDTSSSSPDSSFIHSDRETDAFTRHKANLAALLSEL